MFKTYNKENNTYSRYIHISEIEDALEKMKQISSRIQYKSIDDIPEGNQAATSNCGGFSTYAIFATVL